MYPWDQQLAIAISRWPFFALPYPIPLQYPQQQGGATDPSTAGGQSGGTSPAPGAPWGYPTCSCQNNNNNNNQAPSHTHPHNNNNNAANNQQSANNGNQNIQTQPVAQPYYPYPYPQPAPQQGSNNNDNNQQQLQQQPAYPPQGGIIGFIPVVFFPCANGTVPTAAGQNSTPLAQQNPPPCVQCSQAVPNNAANAQQQQQVNAAQDTGDRHYRRRIRGRRAKNNLTDKPIIDVDTIMT